MLCPGKALPTPQPSLLRRLLSLDVAVPEIPCLLCFQCQQDTQGQSFTRPHHNKSLIKELSGYMLLICSSSPLPCSWLYTCTVLLNLMLSNFPEVDILLPMLLCLKAAWRQAAFVKQGGTAASQRTSALSKAAAWGGSWLGRTAFICKHVILCKNGKGNRHHTDGALPFLLYCLRKQMS